MILNLYGCTVVVILLHDYLLSARRLRGGGANVVARVQGRQAASAGGRSLIVGSRLGPDKSGNRKSGS